MKKFLIGLVVMIMLISNSPFVMAGNYTPIRVNNEQLQLLNYTYQNMTVEQQDVIYTMAAHHVTCHVCMSINKDKEFNNKLEHKYKTSQAECLVLNIRKICKNFLRDNYIPASITYIIFYGHNQRDMWDYMTPSDRAKIIKIVRNTIL